MTTQQTVELPIVELKPCPFCGGEAETSQGGSAWFIHCKTPDCFESHDDFHRTEPEAIAAWNTRPEDNLIKEAVEALTAMVARAPERDTKWAGMTARDIALVTLTKLTGEKQ
jgi:hypothetical protein